MHFVETIRAFFRQRMFQQMLHAAADVSVAPAASGNGAELEMRAGKIDRVGKVTAGIGQRAIEIEHDQIDRFFSLLSD